MCVYIYIYIYICICGFPLAASGREEAISLRRAVREALTRRLQTLNPKP